MNGGYEMKNIKKVLLATGLTTMLALSCPDFSKAASQEDMDYLIETTKKTQSIRKYDEGFEIKALQDLEQVGDLEKNLFFSIYYYPDGKGSGIVPKIFITLNYITHNGDDLDIKQITICDGHLGQPLEGIPDYANHDRQFQKEVSEDAEKRRLIMDIFIQNYNFDDKKENEYVRNIFDKAVEVFKLKTKGKLTSEEQSKYRSLKQEIEYLAMQNEYFNRTWEELGQEREKRLK